MHCMSRLHAQDVLSAHCQEAAIEPRTLVELATSKRCLCLAASIRPPHWQLLHGKGHRRRSQPLLGSAPVRCCRRPGTRGTGRARPAAPCPRRWPGRPPYAGCPPVATWEGTERGAGRQLRGSAHQHGDRRQRQATMAASAREVPKWTGCRRSPAASPAIQTPQRRTGLQRQPAQAGQAAAQAVATRLDVVHGKPSRSQPARTGSLEAVLQRLLLRQRGLG